MSVRALHPGADPGAIAAGLRAALFEQGAPLALGGPISTPLAAGTALVVTTSGSTGYPKSVVLSREAVLASIRATEARIGAGAWLLTLPATYIAGAQVLARSLHAGHEPGVLEGPFTPAAFARATTVLRRLDAPLYTSLVPAQVARLLDAAETDPLVADALDAYATILVGGQALAAPLATRAAARGIRLVRTYGSSETCGGCVYDGLPLDGVHLRDVDGEVHIAGPQLADGYLGDPQRTAEAFVTDAAGTRWYRTGDTGSVDAAPGGPALQITGRRDNVIVSGGINVSLDRVEQVVRTLEGLGDAVVVAAPDERWGEASVIVVSEESFAAAQDGTTVAAVLETARVRVAEAIGAPARPRDLLVVPAVPLLPSGKPDRRAVRQLLEDRHGR